MMSLYQDLSHLVYVNNLRGFNIDCTQRTTTCLHYRVRAHKNDAGRLARRGRRNVGWVPLAWTPTIRVYLHLLFPK